MHNLYPKQRREEHAETRRKVMVSEDIYTKEALKVLRTMDATPEDIERLLPEYREIVKQKHLAQVYLDKADTPWRIGQTIRGCKYD